MGGCCGGPVKGFMGSVWGLTALGDAFQVLLRALRVYIGLVLVVVRIHREVP